MASIDEIKNIIHSTPISSIINYYHPITKRGGNFEGICPFHGDTKPSLKVNDSKGIYKCFACGAGGDAIKFVQDKLNVEFIDAIKDIAEKLSLNLDEFKAKSQDPQFEMALRVLSAANKIYRKVAQELNPQAYSDFLKNRKITEESVRDFQLGYAPGNSGLSKYLETLPENDKKFAIETAQKVGLIRKQNPPRQGHYDFYRDRVIFPIWDHAGKVRGFSSRAVLPNQQPKYLNSGESFIFDKGNILYGFNLAKKHIREQDSVIIVEGNMDALMLHQFGFKNSVATMGVSLSIHSIKLLANMTKNFYLAMDSDPAGIKAMERINKDLLENDIVAKYISFEPAKDPDEFLNTEGRLALLSRIEAAPSFVDFCIERAIPSPIPETTDQKLIILQKIFEILAPMKTSLFASEKLIQCAKNIGMKSSPDDIIAEYKSFLEGQKHPSIQNQPPIQVTVERAQENSSQISEQVAAIETIPISKAQKNVLETLIVHPECCEGSQIAEILDLIDHFEVKRIILWLKKIYFEIDEADYNHIVLAKLNEAIPQQIKQIIVKQIKTYEPTKLNSNVIEKMLNDLLIKLKEESLKKRRDELKQQQKASQTDEESFKIMSEIQQIQETLLKLRNK